MVRPIPTGLKLINAKKLGKYPWSTKDVKYAYDPFNIQKDSVSFITWTQPVPGTVPLYLHVTPEKTSYPSFDPNPPCDPTGWTQDILSPIYVLVDSETHETNTDANLNELPKWKKNGNNIPIFKFKGEDNRCVPDLNGVSIEECFLTTDEDILHINDRFGPTSLLTTLAIDQVKKHESKKYIEKFFRKLPPYAIMIVLLLFIISLIACIVILSK